MRRLPTALLFIGLSSAGCSEHDPALRTVEGHVTMDDRPVAELIVTFTPQGTTAGNGGLGATDDNGYFKLTGVRGGPGILPGDYKISVYPAPNKATADLPTDVVSSGAIGIPPVFTNPNRSPLNVTVGPNGSAVKVRLTKTGQGAGVDASELADSP